MGNCYSCNDEHRSSGNGEIVADSSRYFAYQYGDKFAGTVFSYEAATKKSGRIVSVDTINVQEYFTVQVLQDLYSYAHDVSETSLVRYSDLSSGRPLKTEMKNP